MYLGFMLLIFLPTDPEMQVLLQDPLALLKEIGWAYAFSFVWYAVEAYSDRNKRLLTMASLLDIFGKRLVFVHLVIVVGGVLYIELSKNINAGPVIMAMIVLYKTFVELKALQKKKSH